MAIMIPDKLPINSSKGEKETFELLQRLPDDCLVYYEPVIANRYPDFVVLIPQQGVLIIEVKGWYPKNIESANHQNITVNGGIDKHPTEQARSYKFRLMDACKKYDVAGILLQKQGNHEGNFCFPFGHVVVMSNITDEQMEETKLRDIFPSQLTIARNQLKELVANETVPQEMLNFFCSYFDPKWDVTLTEEQVDLLRAVIHPEVFISNQLEADGTTDLKTLDLKQEQHARSIGEGHRIIYGVAGSGKTLILMARIRILSEDKNKRILFLCFNRGLCNYVTEGLKDCKNVKVTTLDSFARDYGVYRGDKDPFGEENEKRMCAELLAPIHQTPESEKYDAIFVDEAQDIQKEWFPCILAVHKDSLDGDLVIVGDGSQRLYKKSTFTWKEVGIAAVGRTITSKFDLDKNYRNTKEIAVVAQGFAQNSVLDNTEEQPFTLDANKCVRSGYRPLLIVTTNIEATVATTLQNLERGVFGDQQIPVCNSADVAILCRSNKETWQLKFPTNNVQTVNYSKGLQYKAVVLIQDNYNFFSTNDDYGGADKEHSLCYVGVTRATDYLIIICHTTASSALIAQLKTNGGVTLLE